MAQSNHTPGPWTVRWDSSRYARFINGPKFDEIAEMRGAKDWPKQNANARLIAAAPELLEACKAAARIACHLPHTFGDDKALLEAAIAKATVAPKEGGR